MSLRLFFAVVFASVVATLAIPSSAQAVSWEHDYATRIEPLTYLCSHRTEAGYGGLGIDPDYVACFRMSGDYLRVMDKRADGYAAVMKWAFYPRKSSGNGYVKTASRKGLCVYTGGSVAARNAGVCNKNLPEVGLIKFWAGKRISGSFSQSNMRFGSPACVGLNGSAGVGDPKCLLLALP